MYTPKGGASVFDGSGALRRVAARFTALKGAATLARVATRPSWDRIDALLQRAQRCHVAVLGDVMLDVYLVGTATRISPEAPVPVVRVADEHDALGGAANVAANVVALGARCTLLGVVGRDDAGRRLRAAAAAAGITSCLLAVEDRPTTVKTRVMARNHQIVRFDRESERDLPSADAARLMAQLEDAIGTADVVVLEDYNKGVLTPEVIDAALTVARRYGRPVVVDPKFRHFFAYRGATVFKPNAAEIAAAFGTDPRHHQEEWLAEAHRRLGCDYLLVTLGEEGMVLREPTGQVHRIPALARQVYDVSGAGDTVTACLAVCLAAGARVEEAAWIANVAAAVEVGKPGVAPVFADEVRHAVRAVEWWEEHPTGEPWIRAEEP